MSRPEFSNDRLGILHGITQHEQRERPPSKSTEANDRQDAPLPSKSSGSEPRKSKFRFKKKRKRGGGGRGGEDGGDRGDREDGEGGDREDGEGGDREDGEGGEGQDEEEEKADKRRRQRKKKYHSPFEDDPTQYDDSYIPNMASWNRAADPDAAFRESLFDAMADDEGAAFWEGVYGQPIHIFERPEVKDEKGSLERMTDDEYTSYVREKMWEKSHQHIMEERARREETRARRKREQERERLRWEQEERERRARERARRKQRAAEKMHQRWEDYVAYWDGLARGGGVGDPSNICWPVASSKARDVTKESVEEFMLAAPRAGGQALRDVLKTERIRWHPDKAQQRWGMDALGEIEMRAITTVFQTIDGLWSDHKSRQ